jgi:hypothetical protein
MVDRPAGKLIIDRTMGTSRSQKILENPNWENAWSAKSNGFENPKSLLSAERLERRPYTNQRYVPARFASTPNSKKTAKRPTLSGKKANPMIKKSASLGGTMSDELMKSKKIASIAICIASNVRRYSIISFRFRNIEANNCQPTQSQYSKQVC